MGKPDRISTVLCDLDGVVWLAHRPIPGAVEALRCMRDAGIEVVFVTNNSFSTRAEQVAALAAIGVDADDRIVTSAMSAARHVGMDGRVLVCGGRGLAEEVAATGAEVVVAHERPGVDGSFDSVVVGMHREFSYQVLVDALNAIRGGARLVGSNADSTYPTPSGLLPGGGSILAAIAHASGARPTVTGKPHRPMAEMALAKCANKEPRRMLMVGDRPDTDGAFAATLGCGFALVTCGVTSPTDLIDVRDGDVVLPDLAAVAGWVMG